MDMALESYVPVVIFAIVALLFPLGTFFATRLFRPDHPTQLKVAFGPKLKDAKVVRERLVELVIDRAELIAVCTYLKDTLGFEHLSCVTAVDWKDHFESIYHIENYYNGCMVQVNAQIPYDDPKIASLI